MNEEMDQLSETFAAHEYLTPNVAEVLEQANLRARTYRRRRRAAQATGVSVLGAGMVAGGVALPNLKWHQHGSSSGATVSQPLAGLVGPIASASPSPTPPSPSPTPPSPSPISSPTLSATASPATYTEQQEIDAFIADGYDYDNAVALSSLWHETDLAKVKATAGLQLLQGATLPVTPSGTPATPQEKALNAYFAAGYDYNDAVTLGTLWHQTDVTQIKTDAGQKLLAGQTLPIAPSTVASSDAPQPVVTGSTDAAALAAYFKAGYDYDNAVTLAGLWHETDIAQVKSDAGLKILAQQPLPISPATPPPSS